MVMWSNPSITPPLEFPRREILRRSFWLVCCTFLLGLFSSLSYSQTEAPDTVVSVVPTKPVSRACPGDLGRPCIALVLGGGGARGGAHIGVLKALEELQIPIDLVVGTSIGSFVGGLYASGRPVSEIETLFTEADWNSGYQDSLDRDRIPNRRKQQLDKFPIHIDLGVGLDGVKFPKGFVQGQGMKSLIDSMVGRHTIYTSFDDLPTPFRAVAADIESGEEVVIDSGDLAQALQISMSLPGFLRPIERDGRVLVDGGIANNVPISVAKDLGADVVIAVDIGSPPLDSENLGSSFTILRQLTALLTRKNIEYQKSLLTPSDVYILPDIENVTMLSFDTILEAIGPGYAATMAQFQASENFQALASLPRQRATGDYLAADDRLSVDKILLQNNTRLSDDYLLHRLRLAPGNSYSLRELQKGMDRLYGQGTISRIYTSVETEDDENTLDITVDEKEWGPGYLDLKMSFEDDFDSFSRYQVGAAYRRTNLSPYGAEWVTTGEFGTEKKISTELYWPIKNSGFFWDIELGHQRDVLEYLVEQRSVGGVIINQGAIVAGMGWHTTDRFDAQLGLTYGHGKIELPIFVASQLGINTIEAEEAGAVFEVNYDTLDHSTFPSRGWKMDAIISRTNANYLGASDTANQVDLAINGVFSLGRHSFRQLYRYQSATNDDPTSLLGTHSLGGFLNLSGNVKDSIIGREVRFFSSVYTYRLINNEFGAIDLPLYLGLSLEAGNAWDTRGDINYGELIYSGSAFIAWDSPIGPAYLAYGKSDTDESSLYFFLGITF